MAASAEGSPFTFSPPPPRSPRAVVAPSNAAAVSAASPGAALGGADPAVGSPTEDGPEGVPSLEQPAAAPRLVASAGTLGVPGAAALDERSNRPAGLLAVAGSALTAIGVFAPWRGLADEQVSGWRSGAGAVVLLGLAVAAVAMAVALQSGVRSLALRLGLALSGLVAAGVGLFEMTRVADADAPEATVGLGLLLVVGGGALLVGAGALSRHRRFLPVRRPRS